MAFVKLDTRILRSTIWDLDAETCKVFITLLAMASPSGLVDCCSPGVAHEARLPIEKTEACLAILSAPDPRSRTKTSDGRRIEWTDEGYLILNYLKYRERDHTNAERQARFKSKEVTPGNGGNALPAPVTPLPSASASDSACASGTLPLEGVQGERKRKLPGEDCPAFCLCYGEYPKHEDRAKAWGAWRKIGPDDDLVAKIRAAIAAQKGWKKWQEGYIKTFERWLNASAWLDEAPAAAKTIPPAPTKTPEQIDAEKTAAWLRSAHVNR